METPTIISKLLTRISYLESLLTTHSIPFDLSDPPLQSKPIFTQNPCSIKTSLEIDQNPLNIHLIERYSRQMLLPEISYLGQKKIINAKVLVVGAGGIGTPALYYLAGLGIGTIGIIDGDKVEESNLHRQILHKTARVGMNKATSALKTLRKFNPNVNYLVYKELLTVNNCEEIIEQFDIILDASDNALTRYLVNDICIIKKKILVSGSALGWEGQLSVFGLGGDCPCYRCLFPICPKNMMSCGEAGVVGMVPGIMGLLEAMEALKIILEVEEGILRREMLIYDGIRSSFKKIKLRGRQKDCIICGENRSIIDVKKYDYTGFVGANCNVLTQLEPGNNIKWSQFLELYEKERENLVLIDVRSEAQFAIIHLPPFKNVLLEELRKKEGKFFAEFDDKEKKIFVMCRRGNNSKIAVKLLLSQQYKNVYSIEGGITAFGDQNYALIPKI